jgi:hypothetical protein
MKYSKYFGAKRRGFIKVEVIWRQEAQVIFKSQNIRCDSVKQKILVINETKRDESLLKLKV